MFTRETLQAAVDDTIRREGEWSYDIPLPFGIWTRGNQGVAHTRLKRIVGTLVDLAGGSLNGRRVLDLGCLEGLFAIECALQGAEAVGVDIRAAHLEKANLCKAALDLKNLTFSQDDVRNISPERYGIFDFIVCSGILYHLPAAGVFELVRKMQAMTRHAVVIDTHVGMRPELAARQGSTSYWGVGFREHSERSCQKEREAAGWGSWDNTTSFWLTRPSLVNLLMDAGFSTVFECLSSPPLDGELGLDRGDRCTFVALKGSRVQLSMSPAANGIDRRWPEGSLSYANITRQLQLARDVKARVRLELARLLRRKLATTLASMTVGLLSFGDVGSGSQPLAAVGVKPRWTRRQRK